MPRSRYDRRMAGKQVKRGQISYQKLKGWKYRTTEEYQVQTPIKPERDVSSSGEYVRLMSDGLMVIKKGYAWDGPSGMLVPDLLSLMRASLVHDAFYQLSREGLIDLSQRDEVDELFRGHCIEDGTFVWLANFGHWGVERWGEKHARPRPEDEGPEILKAP